MPVFDKLLFHSLYNNIMVDNLDKVLSFDDRAMEYSKRTFLHPNTLKGDVETAYTIAASEQLDLDRDIYMPCINYLMQAVEKLSDFVMGYCKDGDLKNISDNYRKGSDEQLSKIPYMLRKLPSGPFLKTESEK